MLKSLINKLLSFFTVAQETPEIENVEHGSGPGWYVLKVLGRHVFVSTDWAVENGTKVAVTDLTKARYVNFKVNYEKIGGHGQPGHDIEWLDGDLSQETHDALVRRHERMLEGDKINTAKGNPPGFERRIVRLYPPHPKEAATGSQKPTEHPQP